jgi:hypothetical protein
MLDIGDKVRMTKDAIDRHLHDDKSWVKSNPLPPSMTGIFVGYGLVQGRPRKYLLRVKRDGRSKEETFHKKYWEKDNHELNKGAGSCGRNGE